ncbi:MAG: hypothetical protein HN337_01385 [Deltaproteobacteria bacterium]|jgi:hypothetical protein|nr:hypothetical protein [Deltaproteobacteria bacterium]
MGIVRRVIYDWKGNPLKVNDYDVTDCEYMGAAGVFVRDADAPQDVAVPKDDGNKEAEHINNFEYSRSLADQLFRKVIQKG